MPTPTNLPWLAGIRAFEQKIPDDDVTLATWRAAMSNWGIRLHQDGPIFCGDVEIGTWAMLPADQSTNQILAGCDRSCPFVGPRLGALAFDVYEWCDSLHRHELLCGLIKEGRDGIAHQPSGRSWPAVALRQCSLDCCFGKWSLDDGAMLLNREYGPYATWTRETILTPLLAANRDTEAWNVWWTETCHNPLRLVLENGEETRTPFDGAEQILREATVGLWLYDFENQGELLDEESPLW